MGFGEELFCFCGLVQVGVLYGQGRVVLNQFFGFGVLGSGYLGDVCDEFEYGGEYFVFVFYLEEVCDRLEIVEKIGNIVYLFFQGGFVLV